ncbi:hypothetical protein GP486_005158 [Trichoglossum hirsutum]|uniref:Uncharacterized protein n=1 Tax=Trichoglossum hirsutum TaxID=265104 RepID=A0A9P8L9M7_9PEZI|nr:hypothetical protein GP486_005158 [Trichoglossum hirsutum]
MQCIFAIVSLALAARATAGGTYSLPEDAPDGIYKHYIDNNGDPTYEKINIPASTSASKPRSVPDNLSQSANFRRDVDVSCNNFLVGGNDLFLAEDELARFFGSGTHFDKQHSSKQGSVIAFACDYGKNGQQYTDQQFRADMGAVDSVCGPQGAGWNSHKDSRSSYGRTQSSEPFC